MQDDLQKKIASDLGISDMSSDEQQKIISQFGEIALKAATLSVITKMNENKREEFAKLAEAGDASAVKIFLDAEVPEHESLAKAAVAEEVRRFKDFQTS